MILKKKVWEQTFAKIFPNIALIYKEGEQCGLDFFAKATRSDRRSAPRETPKAPKFSNFTRTMTNAESK